MSILKKKCAGEREVFVQKQQEKPAKLNLPPCNSRLLTLTGAKANEIPRTKVQISSSLRKSLIFRIKKRLMFLLIKDYILSKSGNWNCPLELYIKILEILNFLIFWIGFVFNYCFLHYF